MERFLGLQPLERLKRLRLLMEKMVHNLSLRSRKAQMAAFMALRQQEGFTTTARFFS